jgi:hypothetical protein
LLHRIFCTRPITGDGGSQSENRRRMTLYETLERGAVAVGGLGD